MEIISRKEEKHVAVFTNDEILKLLTEQVFKKLGFDPQYVGFESKEIKLKGVNIPKSVKSDKAFKGLIPGVEITILNPVDKRPQPDQKEND